jgi:hypothetical protein
MADIIEQEKVNAPTIFRASHPAKISKLENCAFSLPAGPDFACPGATKACEKCYAQRGRHIFPAVQRLMAKNLVALNNMNGDIYKIYQMLLEMVPNNIPIFRIHESGDFINQEYIMAWAKVIKKRPDTYFWTYTRSFDFNYTALTKNKNFALWASTDNYNINEAKRFVRRYRKSGTKHAFGPWNRNIKIPDGSFICPVTNHKLDMSGACEKCMLCVVKKRTHKNVVFLEH